MMLESVIRMDVQVTVEDDPENPGFYRAMARGVSMRGHQWVRSRSRAQAMVYALRELADALEAERKK